MVERSPSGRATHERSQSPLSPPTVGIPNADLRYVLSDLTFEECSPCRGTGCEACGDEGVLPVWECEQ